MSTSILNPQAIAWSSLQEIHTELLPTVMQRAKRARIGYQVGQIAVLATISNANLFAHTANLSSVGVSNTASLLMLAMTGVAWFGLRALASVHVAWRESTWGYSASSLQKIYKSRPENYDPEGRLKCINCGLSLQASEESAEMDVFDHAITHHAVQCVHCKMKLWPGTTRLSAFLKNLDSRL